MIAVTEQQLQDLLAETAEFGGWWRAHFRPLQTRHGWRVPGTYESGEGWPDLMLFRDEEKIAWELKKDRKNKPTAAQLGWLEVLERAGFETAVVYGDDDQQLGDCINRLLLSETTWSEMREETR